MHIDHSKLVELLTEASGLEQETVEKYLLELVTEINEALEEGEAYEVDGFGVFSRIGENTLFIPADDMATEINYKYAGMSPILLDDDRDKSEAEPTNDTDSDEDPFSGLLDDITETEEEPEGEYDNIDTSDVDDLSDPFALDDEGSAEEEESKDDTDEEEFTPIPNEIDYRSKRTEEESRVLFSGLLEADEEDEDEQAEPEPDLEPDPAFNELDVEDDEEDYKDPFDLGDDILSDEDAEEEIQDEESLEDEPEPVFETESDQTEEVEVEGQADEVDEDKEIEVSETPDEISDEEETEEDPFEALAGEVEDEELEDEESIFTFDNDETEDPDAEETPKEVIPVIKNVASEKQRNKKKSGKANKPKGTKKPVAPAAKKSAPVFLWVILFIVVIAGGVYGLGYFGVVNIPGITPAASSSQQMAVQQNEQAEPETPPQQTEQEATEAGQQATEDPVSEEPEQPQETTDQPEEPVQETTTENESTTETTVPEGQAEYGMDGVPVESANDGYTIVVFSLSDQENAAAKKTELESDGYRVLLAEVPSTQYGSLWRVSLGQFESLRDAAIAAEDLDASLSGNYFITKIQ